MSLRQLPEARTFARPKNFHWDPPSTALDAWADRPMAAADDETTINIFDVIGEDWWSGGGFTSKRMAGILRNAGSRAVTLNINSPGGDMFEGITIYNQLRAHPAEVRVNVMGIAASAASIIAMAGDSINMGLGSFMMVHNAWGVVIGNRHDMTEASSLFSEFDAALADIYVARTGRDRADVEKLMDAESFMAASTAVDEGFADMVDDALQAPDASASNRSDLGPIMARRKTEAALARAGLSRGDRAQVIASLGGARDAAPAPAARDAGDLLASLQKLRSNLS